ANGLDHTGGGRDGYKACQYAAGESKGCRLTLMDAFDDNPGQGACCCCDLSCCERLRRAQSTGKAATCIESEPTYPQKTCTNHGHDQVVRTHGKMRIKFSATNKEGSNKAAYTR